MKPIDELIKPAETDREHSREVTKKSPEDGITDEVVRQWRESFAMLETIAKLKAFMNKKAK